MQAVEAYPLHWPPGRPRTKNRERAQFHRKVEHRYSDGTLANWLKKQNLTIADSRDRLHKEVGLLGGDGLIISSNLRLRQDGLPMSNQREPDDPGIAVYFQLSRQPRCVACDKWDRAADNLAAIAKFIEAMRGQLRWGVGDVNAMFSGFKALPDATVTMPPMSEQEAAEFMARGLAAFAATDYLNGSKDFKTVWLSRAYREQAKRLHPDANGGVTSVDWHLLQRAKEILEQENA